MDLNDTEQELYEKLLKYINDILWETFTPRHIKKTINLIDDLVEELKKRALAVYLLKWSELLHKDLMNSKRIVLEDIESLIKKYGLEEDL